MSGAKGLNAFITQSQALTPQPGLTESPGNDYISKISDNDIVT